MRKKWRVPTFAGSEAEVAALPYHYECTASLVVQTTLLPYAARCEDYVISMVQIAIWVVRVATTLRFHEEIIKRSTVVLCET